MIPASDLVVMYLRARSEVIDAGYEREMQWQAGRRLEKITESDFLAELAWVILCSGMKVQVIRDKWPAIASAFYGFASAAKIAENPDLCERAALKVFGHKGKIRAIISGARIVDAQAGHGGKGFAQLKHLLMTSPDPLGILQEFKFIGKVTRYHLAKNIGLDVAKPDRHLVRIADTTGYSDVQEMCETISRVVGDPVPLVDLVLWRYATLHGDYLVRLQRYTMIPDDSKDDLIRRDAIPACLGGVP